MAMPQINYKKIVSLKSTSTAFHAFQMVIKVIFSAAQQQFAPSR
jgi:hypothetical protein